MFWHFICIKVTLDTAFSPSTGSKSGKLKTEYKHEVSNARYGSERVGKDKTIFVNDESSSFQAATVTADMDLGLSAINATAVVGHKGWLAGYQTCFDITKSAVTKNNFGLGYTAQDFVLHTSVVNGTDFGGSVYQKVQLVTLIYQS